MKVPLPKILATAWSASQPWPVTTTRAPLHYQPLAQIAEIRQREAKTADSLLPLSPLELLADLTSEDINVNDPFFKTAVGLLYLSRLGFVDECHSLVTPLSWHDDTHVGYGPPTPGTEAEAVATYAHVLVHRWEGSIIGELNMAGYSNANFWGKATAQRADSDPALPCDRIRQEMECLLQLSNDDATSKITSTMKLSPQAVTAGREWFQEWIVADLPDGGWEPRALNELGKTLEMQHAQDDPIAEFGSRANQLECDVLIHYCLERVGFEVPLGTASNEQKIAHDSTTALRAASKVSSAHIRNFQQNGIIIIRNVLTTDDARIPAAAVACRLLGASACAIVPSSRSSDAVHLYYTDHHETILGFDLGPGDVLAAVAESLDHWTETVAPCQVDDPSVFYRDALFGIRGETPTTVIQWSKGTIF